MTLVRAWLLGLDTATAWRSLALWHLADDVVWRDAAPLGRAGAARLVPDVAAFLAAHGVRRDDLAGIGVGVGPGSYTGLRSGIATALGLGLALHVPVAGSGTLEAMAFGALERGGTGWAVLDARRGRVHALQAERLGARLRILRGPVTMPRTELAGEAGERFEDVPPDAVWHARNALTSTPPQPRYG